jgi:hypothetical protein
MRVFTLLFLDRIPMEEMSSKFLSLVTQVYLEVLRGPGHTAFLHSSRQSNTGGDPGSPREELQL